MSDCPMADPTLIALTESGLSPQAITLFVTLYARAHNGLAEMPEEAAAARLGISTSRLRGYRSQLNASGLGSVSTKNGRLHFVLAAHLRSPVDQSDQQAITFPATHAAAAEKVITERANRAHSDQSSVALETSTHPDRAHSDQKDHIVIAPPGVDTTAAEKVITERANRAHGDQSDHHVILNGASGGDYRGGRLVGNISSPIPGENLLPTNPPVSADPLENCEAAASEGLLLSLGCENLPAVRAAAQSHPFEAIRAHALAWQRDTKSTGPGGLLYRIRSGNFAVPEITSADRESSLFLRWRTPAELAEDARRQAEIAENDRRIDQERAERDARRLAQAQQAPASPSPSTDSPPPIDQGDDARHAKARELWQMAKDELSLSLPAPTFEQWLRDTDVLSYTDGEFAIGVPHAYARDWLQNRLRPQIKRILGRLLQRSVEVNFAVRPRPNHATS